MVSFDAGGRCESNEASLVAGKILDREIEPVWCEILVQNGVGLVPKVGGENLKILKKSKKFRKFRKISKMLKMIENDEKPCFFEEKVGFSRF